MFDCQRPDQQEGQGGTRGDSGSRPLSYYDVLGRTLRDLGRTARSSTSAELCTSGAMP